ncbi:MAG: magnesium chelatase subunit H [Hyphomicrobium sp.]|nr:MAG: magnesium chelatase subunit H [Hyphomicrobium sp.]PPD00403.1 MAG: magnesium chelatase subunit H [Hyphomicrobium sp.]
MQKHITAAEAARMRGPTVRVVIVTLDAHLASAAERARPELERAIPGLEFSLHAAAEWEHSPDALARCRDDISKGDIIIANMLFMEDHIQAVLPWLQARREHCDAMIGCMSAAEIIRLTRLGNFSMDGSQGGAMALLKRLRGSSNKEKTASGAQQMAMLRRLPKILRFIPGTAQDVRAYFLTLQYWLSGSEINVVNMVRYLVDRYADGARKSLRGTLAAAAPQEYPEVGVYHPRLESRVSADIKDLPSAPTITRGTVGLLIMRSYVLAGNTAHYDGVIAALEARKLRVIPAFATGLDNRPAIEAFFTQDNGASVDAIVSLTGFSLVGGPAYNDARSAEDTLAHLDVPYIAAHALEFQSLEQWASSDRGLMPVESTIMVAIPELDGATGPMVFGGRSDATGEACTGCNRGCVFNDAGIERNMHVCGERAAMLAARVDKLIRLRKAKRAERKVGIVLFNFPPNAGSVGTAAFLSVFASLHNTLKQLRDEGYTVEVPETVDALRDSLIVGNAQRFGTSANVLTRIPTDDHVTRQRWLDEIEAQWGPAPGRQQSDGSSIFVLGARFGNVVVGIQPAFGYEGDPMRLLFEKGFTPTHAFCAFYRYMAEDFGAHALLHFGTHGALEFMPGKQTGMSADCWPDRLIGDMPNLYLYAANNPSEGMIAKRRAAATLISYLTPPIAQAGLYRGLIDLKASIERWRGTTPETANERPDLATLIQAQAAGLDLVAAEPQWLLDAAEAAVTDLWHKVLELEYALIPNGLHVVGEAMSAEDRVDLLAAAAESTHGATIARETLVAIVAGHSPEDALAIGSDRGNAALLDVLQELSKMNVLLAQDSELPAILHALDGGFMRPAPSGDLIRAPQILPTGRNLHGFDPFRIPSAFAVADGAKQATRLLDRHSADGNPLPESIAVVLWGTDNLKSEGGPIAQALALLGAKPRFDSYGRLCGAMLVPLADLGRPRIDVVVTLSGIFRDLLPLQTKLLAEAAFLAASADEPIEQNFVRKHALAYMAANNCDLETASLRVFSNADGTYGSNVNQLIESGNWNSEDELAETYSNRKSFAYGRGGKPVQQTALLKSVLSGVKLTYQNLESVEVGVTTIDHYFDTLGGISRAVKKASGEAVPVYIGDQTRGEGLVRTLSEQVALETRTRMLNPKWYEGMLKHGYEGVRNIEAQVTNTLGWSATTGQVAPWVYQQITQTFVLDDEMRERLAQLNPTASAKVANRLLEAHERKYWQPDADVLEALRRAGEELEDRLEGVGMEAAAA